MILSEEEKKQILADEYNLREAELLPDHPQHRNKITSENIETYGDLRDIRIIDATLAKFHQKREGLRDLFAEWLYYFRNPKTETKDGCHVFGSFWEEIDKEKRQFYLSSADKILALLPDEQEIRKEEQDKIIKRLTDPDWKLLCEDNEEACSGCKEFYRWLKEQSLQEGE